MKQQQSTMLAALWMGASVLSLILMAISGRATTRVLDVLQVMEMRSVTGLLMLTPFVYMAGGLRAMRTRRLPEHIGRNAAHYIGQAGWLFALTLIPLAELISIEFTTPIWTALLAAAFLGERLTRSRIAAIALGILGVIVIMRPSLETLQLGHVVVLAAAVVFGISFTMTKSLTRTESALRIMFWMLVLQSIFGAIPALLVWRPVPMEIWPWIVLIAFSGSFSHYCMARALAHADATVVMPMDFVRLPLSALVGWLLYAEQIDIFTACGAALILSGNLLNLNRKRNKDSIVAEIP